VALQAVIDNSPKEGDHVLVVGGGVIGNLIVQAIRSLGNGCTLRCRTIKLPRSVGFESRR